jgi:hypothetical protein
MVDISTVDGVAIANILSFAGRTLTAGDAIDGLLVPSTASGPITSIQQVSITIATSATSNTAAITSVDTALTSIHFNGIDTASTTNEYALARVELTNATTVTAYRNSADASNTCTVKATVVTWNTDWIQSIQHGTITLTGASSGNATISSVTTANAVAVWLGTTSNTTTLQCARGSVRVKVNSATQVLASRGTTTDNATVGYCVIEWKSAKIVSNQLVTATITNTTSSTNTAISTVDDTNAITFWGGHTAANSSIADGRLDGYRNSTTNVITLRGGTGGQSIANTNIVEFASGTVNQSSRTEISFTGTSDVWALGAISTVDTSKAIILNSGTRGGTATTFPTHLASSSLTSTTQATTNKRTGTNTTVYSIECCEFV